MRSDSDHLHADMNCCLVVGEGSECDTRFAGHAKDMADEGNMAVGLEMLQHLIDCAVDRHTSFHLQTATLFPRRSLHPANVAENATVAPAVGVDIDGEDGFQGAID